MTFDVKIDKSFLLIMHTNKKNFIPREAAKNKKAFLIIEIIAFSTDDP